MATSDPPVTVPDALARVKRVHGNIAKHRKAMEEVAAAAAAAQESAQDNGGNGQ